MSVDVEALCACGAPATANGRECPGCWRERLGTVRTLFAPTRSIGAGQVDRTLSKRWDSRLEDYRATRAEGIQPQGTRQEQIDVAKRLSDDAGEAFSARTAE
jgi:hypothetical protein